MTRQRNAIDGKSIDCSISDSHDKNCIKIDCFGDNDVALRHLLRSKHTLLTKTAKNISSLYSEQVLKYLLCHMK